MFDFGDDHEFNLVLKGINKKDDNKTYPYVILSKGIGPSQYPDYDEIDY